MKKPVYCPICKEAMEPNWFVGTIDAILHGLLTGLLTILIMLGVITALFNSAVKQKWFTDEFQRTVCNVQINK